MEVSTTASTDCKNGPRVFAYRSVDHLFNGSAVPCVLVANHSKDLVLHGSLVTPRFSIYGLTPVVR